MPSPAILAAPLTSESKKISLRSPTHDDTEALHRIFTNSQILESDPGNDIWTRPPYNIGRFVDQVLGDAKLDPPEVAIFLIISTDNSEVIGLTGFRSIVNTPHSRVGDVSIQVLPDFWNKKVGTEALVMSIDYGFGDLDMDQITITTSSVNEKIKNITANLRTKGEWEEVQPKEVIRYTISRIDWGQVSNSITFQYNGN